MKHLNWKSGLFYNHLNSQYIARACLRNVYKKSLKYIDHTKEYPVEWHFIPWHRCPRSPVFEEGLGVKHLKENGIRVV